MEQQGACGLDFEGGPGNCGAIGYDSAAENEAFMLADETPVKLDIMQMLGNQRSAGRRGG